LKQELDCSDVHATVLPLPAFSPGIRTAQSSATKGEVLVRILTPAPNQLHNFKCVPLILGIPVKLNARSGGKPNGIPE
jgi:hypothetical protein